MTTTSRQCWPCTPKQPFNIAGRTGTVVFDVSADSQGGHAAWPEFWWTDQPVPAPNDTSLSGQAPIARNSVGVKFTAQCTGDNGTGRSGSTTAYIGVGGMSVTRNYVYSDQVFTPTGCVVKGTAAALNHFEMHISAGRIEVWGSDPGGSNLHMLAFSNFTMPMDQGLIWIEDVHYNACKFDTQCDHQFTWDNVGFDGPKTYRDYTFDVPDANVPHGDGANLGYDVTTGSTFTVHGVHADQTPTGASVNFNFVSSNVTIPDVSINGGPWHSTAWISPLVETIAVAVPYSEVRQG